MGILDRFRKSKKKNGLGGVDHVSITVPDMQQACDFFAQVLECRELFRMGEFRWDKDDYLLEHLNIHPRSVMKEHRMLECNEGFKISLFEYEAPDQRREMPKNSDIGGHHLAFRIYDIESALARLKKAGIPIMGDPVTFPDGPNRDVTCIYFLSPWGLQLELVYYGS
jgi:catechol 2,3-dioxygenase-like lactoylglutathione lyase family enzyme